jgi:hypothetical protein
VRLLLAVPRRESAAARLDCGRRCWGIRVLAQRCRQRRLQVNRCAIYLPCHRIVYAMSAAAIRTAQAGQTCVLITCRVIAWDGCSDELRGLTIMA